MLCLDYLPNLSLSKVTYKHECNICSNKIERFLPYNDVISKVIYEFDIIGSDMYNFSCPYCYSFDRERHLKMYFDKLNLWKK